MDSRISVGDSQERAISAEPSSTRPNPFDDHDLPSRKRRRTSCSRSQPSSVDTTQEMATNDTTSAQPSRNNSPVSVNAHNDDAKITILSAIKVETTLGEHASATEESTYSPKVTISIRNSVTSDCAANKQKEPEPLTPVSDTIMVEDSQPRSEPNTMAETQMAQPPNQQLGAQSSTQSGGDPTLAKKNSPPSDDIIASIEHDERIVENTVNDSEDTHDSDDSDDSGQGGPSKEAALAQAAFIPDPCAEIPYLEVTETPIECLIKITSFIQNSAQISSVVYTELVFWLDRCSSYFAKVPKSTGLAAFHRNKFVYQRIPSMVTAAYQRRPYMHRILNIKASDVAALLVSFLELGTALLKLDIYNLNTSKLDPDHILESHMVSLSGPWFFTLGNIMSGHIPIHDFDEETDAMTERIRVHIKERILVKMSDNLTDMLLKFVSLMAGFVPRFPIMIECLGEVLSFLTSAFKAIVSSSHLGLAAITDSLKFAAMDLFLAVADKFQPILEKLAVHKNNECVLTVLKSLGDLYTVGLYGSHPQAVERLFKHKQLLVNVEQSHLVDAMTFIWRYDALIKLIQTSHMQLRVQAVTSLSEELVRLWKNSQDWPDHSSPKAAMYFRISHILQSGLVEHILGPSCRPEIISEAGNIVGLLAVSKTFEKVHFDLLWQTLTTTQDPRARHALVRMMGCAIHLLDISISIYMCENYLALDIALFGDSLRFMCDHLIQCLPRDHLEHAFKLCLRLLRESLAFSPRSQAAHQDVAEWATAQLRTQATRWSGSPEDRRKLITECIDDIAAKSSTTLGSLTFLSVVVRSRMTDDLRELVEEHDFTRLLIEELEHAAEAGRRAGYPEALSHSTTLPRRSLIEVVIKHYGSALDGPLGQRLWELLVGTAASCPEDRNVGWDILNGVVESLKIRFNRLGHIDVAFISSCFQLYITDLPASSFCKGTLTFLQQAVAIRNQQRNYTDDVAALVGSVEISQLWRMILWSDSEQLSNQAIEILARDVYMDDGLREISSYQRIKEVHHAVARRCLTQLQRAVLEMQQQQQQQQSPGGSDASQKQLFVRSLRLLAFFERSYRQHPQFSCQDLGTYRTSAPNVEPQGEPARLHYQTFDGPVRSTILPLEIGMHNTVATLLSILYEKSGFANFRVFWKGGYLKASDQFICQTLQDHGVFGGLLLVKNEPPPLTDDGADTLPTVEQRRAAPGASPLQVEILTHFPLLWSFLEMEDQELAHQVFEFLSQLPADPSISDKILQLDDLTQSDLFPPGKAYKCIYAAYALKERLSSLHRRTMAEDSSGEEATKELGKVVVRTFYIVEAAISDIKAADLAKNAPEHDRLLAYTVVDLFATIIAMAKEFRISLPAGETDQVNLDQFMRIASITQDPDNEQLRDMSLKAFASILDMCLVDTGVWKRVRHNPEVSVLMYTLILDEPLSAFRDSVVDILRERINAPNASNLPFNDVVATPLRLSSFFWAMFMEFIPLVAQARPRCKQYFEAVDVLLYTLENEPKFTASLDHMAVVCAKLLLEVNSTENLGQPLLEDNLVAGLVRLLKRALDLDNSLLTLKEMPRNLGCRLVKAHLFPSSPTQLTTPSHCVVTADTRASLYNVVTNILTLDKSQCGDVIKQLEALVPYRSPVCGEDGYDYDLSISTYDRNKNLRPLCGYVGLRNLANTCYFNSLMTQLFMNVEFRRFMMTVQAEPSSLIDDTQTLFGNMQESHSRSIDTWCLVRSIKTYDDTIIDINNQMDVDEFYNLLFDRWEGQMAGPEEKKALRSFYGGELVQQVKSKECDHVSTRTEPFQAIQCDIKGKSTLEESLQAYVGGEVMAGENKYKCSTCNLEVVAVKRACLDKIPDNLIFHLKRFDFNLRTLQRSKINDYFSFPTSINMRPYTVEYLESVDAMEAEDKKMDGKESSSSADKQEPDMFELVGILVHTGTAESGHYYSFIRERPSNESTDQWIQFNDEIVSKWDPAAMKECTFGGIDYRPDNTTSEKHHSAYMLFYERVPALKRHQARAIEEQQEMPLRVPVPTKLADSIRRDNLMMLRQYCILDPVHVRFVKDVANFLWTPTSVELLGATERHAIGAIMGHLDQVISRTRDVWSLNQMCTVLSTRINANAASATSLMRFFHDNAEMTRWLLQKHGEIRFREATAILYLEALRVVKTELPAEYASLLVRDDDDDGEGDYDDDVETGDDGIFGHVGVAIDSVYFFRRLWSNFHANSKAWQTVFGVVLDFARMGSFETALLLGEDWLYNLMRIVWFDAEYSTPQLVKMRNNISKPGRPAPCYDAVIMLIQHLMSRLTADLSSKMLDRPSKRMAAYLRARANGCEDVKLPWVVDEINILYAEGDEDPIEGGGDWIESLILVSTKDDKVHLAIEWILSRLISMNRTLDATLYQLLLKNVELGLEGMIDLEPYLRAAITWCVSTSNMIGVTHLIYVPTRSDCGTVETRHAIEFYTTLATKLRLTKPLSPTYGLVMSAFAMFVPKALLSANAALRSATQIILDVYMFGLVGGDQESDAVVTIADDDVGGEETLVVEGTSDQHKSGNNKSVGIKAGDDGLLDEPMADDADAMSDATMQGDDEVVVGAVERVVAEAARELAMYCIQILGEHPEGTATIKVTRDTVARVRQVLDKCRRFFGEKWNSTDVEGGVATVAAFDELRAGTIDPIWTVLMDEAEDEGSVWDSQSASSDVICVTDELEMQTMPEFESADTES